jgi:hypothetical protein
MSLLLLIIILMSVTSHSQALVLKGGLKKANLPVADRHKDPNYALFNIPINLGTCDVDYDLFHGVADEDRNFYMETFHPQRSSSKSGANLAQLEVECGFHFQTSGGRKTYVKTDHIPYTRVPPRAAFEVHLVEVRDSMPGQFLGFDLGRGKELACVVQGDHGGDLMSFIQVYCTHEGCNQEHTIPLGSSAVKESHEVLSHLITPTIDAGETVYS